MVVECGGMMWTAGDNKDRERKARDGVDGKIKDTEKRRGNKLRRQGDNI